MRNLSVLSQRSFQTKASHRNHTSPRLQASTSNLEDDTLYSVTVWQSSPTSPNVKLTFVKKAVDESILTPFASIVVPAAPPPAIGSAAQESFAQDIGRDLNQIVSFHFLADGGSAAQNSSALCTITAGGDILLLPLHQHLSGGDDDIPASEPEIVGSVEQGLLAAAWSPDDELLVLVTGETPSHLSETGKAQVEKLLLMTRDFEVLSENVLRTDDFGQERPVDVGWGSKATQFHGSEGKAAAAAAAEVAAAAQRATTNTRGPKLPDDDGRPRISWRGDGAFFAISSLEPFPLPMAEATDAQRQWFRLIRVYARLGSLSATSDATVRGISQALAFRPIGNLIAATQRFGESWAQGRKSRHDVAFFERNGLRHGEFSLREEGTSQPGGIKIGWQDSQNEAQWTRSHFIRELAWNSDGTALAVWLTREANNESGGDQSQVDVVQIWTTGNYHWYLKQEFVTSDPNAKVQQVKWHVENPAELLITYPSSVQHKVFYYETSTSGGRPPYDAACVAVADGNTTLLTPFRMQNVPPPMSTTSLLVPPTTNLTLSAVEAISVPIHNAWTQLPSSQPNGAAGLLALLFQNQTVQLWMFDWGVLGGKHKVGGQPVAEPKLVASIDASAIMESKQTVFHPYQVAVAGWPVAAVNQADQSKVSVAILGTNGVQDSVCMLDVTLFPATDSFEAVKASEPILLPSSVNGRHRIASDPFIHKSSAQPGFYVEMSDGQVSKIFNGQIEPLVKLGHFCPDLQLLARPNGLPSRVIGFAPNGRLFANSYVVAKDATSFTLAGSFLVWTNSAHEARFVPISTLPFESSSDATFADVGANQETIDLGRRVERGSRIVTAVPSQMALVLQMPRGNLETICPRPLVLEVVRRELDLRRYGSAFRTCRTHRMDVNVLYDHDPISFMANVDKFVAQVADVDHINLFLSGLRNEDVTTTLYKPLTKSTGRVDVPPSTSSSTWTENKVNRICDTMRQELEKVDKRKYINSILTAHVRKVPADYEAGLGLLLELKQQDQQMAEEAVKYIIFLADAEKLFDLALGMYDFTLTLMVAQHAQRKDPREYLPFLRELRSIEPIEYQRFKIDDYLKRHNKALEWLSKSGRQHHQAALDYMDQYKLYEDGLIFFADDASKLRDAHNLFGEYLLTGRKYTDAASCFVLAAKPSKAREAFREAGQWQEVFSLAFSEKLSAVEIVQLARQISEQLDESKRYTEAARVILEYGRDLEQSVSYLCKANEFSDAKRLASSSSRTDLIETHIAPALLESKTTVIEDLDEMTEQLDKQMTRIYELRTRKQENPAMFYGEEDDVLDNVDVMSDTSTQMTQFTRYTSTASLVTSNASSLSTFSQTTRSSNRKKLNKMKKKEEKKKAAGKKGSIYEEEYLYESIQKLIKDRLASVQNETAKLLPHLAILSSTYKQAGRQLTISLSEFEKKALQAIEILWTYTLEDERKKLERMVTFEQDLVQPNTNQTVTAITVRSILNDAKRPVRCRLTMAESKWKVVLFEQR